MAIVHFRDYETFKNTLDQKMAETANHFVMIGYLLKEARDTNILAESGYSSVGEFARMEYGLDETKTSRFISICEKYGNGEDRLLPQFERYGYAKLSEMLTLPESVTEVLSPEITKEEIREIKAEVRKEEAVSDLEMRLEEKPETDNLLAEAVKAYLHEYPQEFIKVFNATGDWRELMEAIAPNESVTLMMRVSGVGRLMIRVESYDTPVKLVNIRENITQEYSRAEFTAAIDAALDVVTEDAREAWKEIYGEDMPTVEEKTEEKPRKESKEKKIKIAPAQKTEVPEINPPEEKKESQDPAAGQQMKEKKDEEEELTPAGGQSTEEKAEEKPMSEGQSTEEDKDTEEKPTPAAGQPVESVHGMQPPAAGQQESDALQAALEILEAVPEGGTLEYEKVKKVITLIRQELEQDEGKKGEE